MPRVSRTSSSRRVQNKLFARVKKWSLGIVVATIVVWIALISLSYAQWGKVHEFNFTESHHIDAEMAREHIQNILDSHWPIMGNRDRHWALPNKRIKESVRVLSDSIRTIDLQYNNHVLDIGLTFFEADYISCFTDQDQCWFTSSDGYVFALAPEFSEGVYPVVIIDKQTPKAFPYRLPKEYQNIVVKIFKEAPIGEPVRISIDALDVQIYMQKINGIPLPANSYIVVSRDQIVDYENYVRQRFEALGTKTDFFQRLESGVETFKYLDIRFVDKMYVKFSE